VTAASRKSPDLSALASIDSAGAIRIGAFLAIGVFAGYLAVPPPKSAVPDLHPPEVTLDGKALPMVGDPKLTLDAAKRIARGYVLDSIKLTAKGGQARDRSREDLGARVDPVRLAKLVDEVRDPTSALRRAHEQIAKGKPLRLPMPVTVDDQRALSALLQVKDELDKSPVDARLDYETKRLLPDQPGRRVDLFGTLAKLDGAFQRGERTLDAVVDTTPAERTIDQLKGIQYDDVLGYFETKYAADNKHEARTYNLKMAASKLDGHVIMPGEVFDFNDVVGPRTEANGYKVATVIAQGELVDGIGGGTCQVAGTLHGAAFFAGLDIVERKPHTRPSFYIKMGMDATVVYPTITMKFRNPFSFPIVLHETVTQGLVRAEILGPKRERDVTFVRKINDVTPFQEREIQDPKIPRGQRMLTQRGIPGFKITRYRVIRDGSSAVREKMSDVYPSTTQIWRVGTGEADPKFQARDDEHPEYVADEYLMVTQGPHVSGNRVRTDERGGGTVESRVAGKYGTHGWTVREGFTKSLHGTGRGSSDRDDNPGVD